MCLPHTLFLHTGRFANVTRHRRAPAGRLPAGVRVDGSFGLRITTCHRQQYSQEYYGENQAGLIFLSTDKNWKTKLAVVFVDPAGAFHMVPLKHLESVLEKRGVDEAERELMNDPYKHCYPSVRATEGNRQDYFDNGRQAR